MDSPQPPAQGDAREGQGAAEDAALDGSPLSTSRLDPQLVAAERVIAHLRCLLGALAAREPDGQLVLGADELSGQRAKHVTFARGRDGEVSVRVPAEREEPAAPAAAADTSLARHAERLRERLARNAPAPEDGSED